MDFSILNWLVSDLMTDPEKEALSEKQTAFTVDMLEGIKGIFAIHITVDDKDIYKINSFCNFNNIELAYAIGSTGCHKQQLMTSIYKDKTNGKDAVVYAHKLAGDMQDFGITVLRIKVETLAKSAGVSEFMKTDEYKKNKHYYFEFHFKVTVKNQDQQDKLDEICKKYNASYAVNFLSKNRKDPLISYRVRGEYDKAVKLRDDLHKAFLDAGVIPLLDGTHYEFTLYDTNYELDRGMVPEPKKC